MNYYEFNERRCSLKHTDLIDFEETVEAVVLETPVELTDTTCRPVMNPPPQGEARNRDMRLHGKRIQPPRAEELEGASTEQESRPEAATGNLSLADPPLTQARAGSFYSERT